MTVRTAATAARVWSGLRTVLLDLEDRRREVAEATDMSFLRTKALRLLVSEPQSLRSLAARLATDAPYTTVVVDDLEARGLVTRTVSPDDRRVRIVAATAAGVDVARTAQRILDRPPQALLDLSAADLAVLDRIVATLLATAG